MNQPDEELLKPGREYMALLLAKMEAMRAETVEKIERHGRDDKDYARTQWNECYRAIEPMRREYDAIAKTIADYYGCFPQPPIVIRQ